MKYSKLILKNILRNKRRTLLTISSLVVSLFLMITLGTILTELTRGGERANPLHLITRHSVSLVFPLPASQRQRIATVPGVKNVMSFSWFGGIYKDQKNFFANFAVDADRAREIMTTKSPTPSGRRSSTTSRERLSSGSLNTASLRPANNSKESGYNECGIHHPRRLHSGDERRFSSSRLPERSASRVGEG
jgi:putative ABC transport system permease protein